MVSFWPFRKREDSSPDSFERTLSQLAAKIQTRNAKIAFLRQRLRKIKAVWTLYTIFAWVLYAVGAVFVVGIEPDVTYWGVVVGGPVVIYGVRKAVSYIFEYQISSAENSLADLKTEQRETIEKLKEATKFYSTQSILEKYGDVKPEAKEKPKPAQQTPQRPRPAGPPGQPTPEQLRQQAIQKQLAVQVATTGPRGVPGEEIPSSPPIPGAAPVQLPPQLAALQNQPPPLITEVASEPRWYDRILDVLVGEDETSAKARYALICFNCRMVNGLAPPGSKGPDDAGQWGCARCGAMNGKPKEEPRVEEVAEPEEVEEKPRRTKKKRTPRPKTPEETTDDNDNLTPETGDETEEEVVEEPVEVAKESEDEEKTKVRRRKVGKRKA